MEPFRPRKHIWRASWGLAITLSIGTFQFMAIANVMFVIPSILIMLWMLPASIEPHKIEPTEGAAFTSSVLLLVSAVMFLTTTPPIIIAWAFRLRDGYELQSLIFEAALLATVTIITAIATITVNFAKKDLEKLFFKDDRIE